MLAKPNEEKMNADKPHPIEPQMDYDIVEDIKKIKANVSLFEMCKVPQQKERLLKALEASDERILLTIVLKRKKKSEKPAVEVSLKANIHLSSSLLKFSIITCTIVW